jgi:hypothetical protein
VNQAIAPDGKGAGSKCMERPFVKVRHYAGAESVMSGTADFRRQVDPSYLILTPSCLDLSGVGVRRVACGGGLRGPRFPIGGLGVEIVGLGNNPDIRLASEKSGQNPGEAGKNLKTL